jgi:hypothetical protein
MYTTSSNKEGHLYSCVYLQVVYTHHIWQNVCLASLFHELVTKRTSHIHQRLQPGKIQIAFGAGETRAEVARPLRVLLP